MGALCHMKTQQDKPSMNQKGDIHETLDLYMAVLELPRTKTIRNKCLLLFVSCLVSEICYGSPKQAKIIIKYCPPLHFSLLLKFSSKSKANKRQWL